MKRLQKLLATVLVCVALVSMCTHPGATGTSTVVIGPGFPGAAVKPGWSGPCIYKYESGFAIPSGYRLRMTDSLSGYSLDLLTDHALRSGTFQLSRIGDHSATVEEYNEHSMSVVGSIEGAYTVEYSGVARVVTIRGRLVHQDTAAISASCRLTWARW
jgi:hypothetical protein